MIRSGSTIQRPLNVRRVRRMRALVADPTRSRAARARTLTRTYARRLKEATR